ncbi:MAG: hypothetical protein LQ343_001032, partial [Gyalolechia ehrenbergii]
MLAPLTNLDIQNSKRFAKNGSNARKRKKLSGRARMSANAAPKGVSPSMASPMILPRPPPARTMPQVLGLICPRLGMHQLLVKCSPNMPAASNKCIKRRVTESATADTRHIHLMGRVNR